MFTADGYSHHHAGKILANIFCLHDTIFASTQRNLLLSFPPVPLPIPNNKRRHLSMWTTCLPSILVCQWLQLFPHFWRKIAPHRLSSCAMCRRAGPTVNRWMFTVRSTAVSWNRRHPVTWYFLHRKHCRQIWIHVRNIFTFSENCMAQR